MSGSGLGLMLVALLSANAGKTVTTVSCEQGIQFALPYAADWTVVPADTAIVYVLSEDLGMVASVSVDAWGEPVAEREYLAGQLDALKGKVALDDASVGGFGAHPVLSYRIALPNGAQLNAWAVRQQADRRVVRLHVSAVAKEPAALVTVRARIVQLLATGFVVPQ